MALLKRKQEKTGIASIRLPMSAIQELQTLRQLADDKGYDLNASMADALLKWMKQARDELGANNDAEDKAVSTNPNNLLGRAAPATASSATTSDITAGCESLPALLAQPIAVATGSNGSPSGRA
jgi:hypothetical protein